MRRIREVLRLKTLGLGVRGVGESLGLGASTVSEYLLRAKAAGISWPLPEGLDDEALENLLFPDSRGPQTSHPVPDWVYVHTELKRKHVTLALLWQEYRGQHPDGFQYSRFCELYRAWEGTLGIWMRQDHKGGEKLFVDYSGDGIPMVEPETGEVTEAQLFVGVMGASNYTYAEATETQTQADWAVCHANNFEYLEGVPHIVVPDQARTAIKVPCLYDPALNPSYEELARHFDTCIVPARPRSPKDKGKVEGGVLLAQRWIIAAVRNMTLVGIEAVKQAIKEPLEKLNNRVMRKFGKSRRQLFEEIDKPNLKPLPKQRYEFSVWIIGARVNLDYHVEFEKHYYSVPYQHVHKKVDIRANATTVEIFLDHKRIASHLRSHQPHRHTTVAEHMPKSHQKHLEWTPTRIVNWAKKIGPSTGELVERIMAERPHPEQGYRACLGIIRLEKRYCGERLEKACRRALACRSHGFRAVDAILRNNLEDKPLPERTGKPLPPHGNVRGGKYYN